MNTPGHNNGLLEGWLDGKKHLSRGDIQFRRNGETAIGVRHMWHNVYFGGRWPTPNDLSLVYDEVEVSASGRVGCLSPFIDIADSVHRKSIVELHALGHLRGCDYRRACPTRLLTRGEAAAFISRILRLPAATRDYFSDDAGNTFEPVINRIAAAGITVGCGTPGAGTYCPDKTMTRAEFATMLARALGLRGDAPDAFADDDGHWAEGAIDRFADAGLTTGCDSNRFCPNRPLPREEAAAFFDRSLRLLRPLDLSSIDPPTPWPPPGEPDPIPAEETD